MVAGLVLAPGAITADAGRMLVTFLGLVSASILPTVSLLINSMTASGRSVMALDELESELHAAMDGLLLLFGCVAVVVAALVALATPPGELFTKVPYLTSQILPRSGQATVVVFSAIILSRVGQIPAVLRRSLIVRHKIAVEEARRKTLEKAPAAGSGQQMFATHPDFGKSVRLDELTGKGN
ncbi:MULTISPECIES: hypothetical protein [unclassified Sphingopyxis]|uniref:hypothetical protein n=1 Tax=unclassified Sphingopyxis TaxID=2614943 RepID=UPI00286276B1|nr:MULTISPECIES: hypothetical protein [unclassified Sphingopyxis]MDR7058769.1 hypothetical protein [Sphingopyxis sp. BE235]MDR7179045.1 hypothetical protein [Sphingopyxis sp. BE249]